MEKNRVFGGKCIELYLKYDHESQCWRTSQLSLFEEALPSLDRLPKSGMMQHGSLYRLETLELHIDEIDGSVLPTPIASDVKKKIASPSNLNSKDRGYGLCLSAQLTIDQQLIPQEEAIGKRHTLNPSFVEWMMGFPTGWTLPE